MLRGVENALGLSRSYFLHLMRHPHSVIQSGLHLARDILGDLHSSREAHERAWVGTNLNIHHFFSRQHLDSRRLTLRYEDLVRQPEAALRTVCDDLLRLAWEPAMAQPHTMSEATNSFQAARKFATTDPKLLRREAIDPGQVWLSSFLQSSSP